MVITSKARAVCLAGVLALAACTTGGSTGGAVLDYGQSSRYSQAEVTAAADVVLAEFRHYWSGCELRRLWYDETWSDEQITDDLTTSGGNSLKESGADIANAMIWRMDFYAGKRCGSGVVSPGQLYTDYSWILVREGPAAAWTILDQGYG